jgi:DNA topoisomerase-3
MLPNLNKGDVININFNPVSKKTSALKHYTIETLNNYLKNPFKEDKKKNDEDDEEDYKAMFEGIELGTEATRTSIIKNAINSKYIELKKDTYYILNQGIYLIESLNYMNINMDKYKTINLSKALKKVFHGKIKVLDAVNIATDEIKNVFNSNTDDIGLYGDYIGKCPKCKKDVIRNRYGYGCSGYKDGCNFSIPRVICKKVISKNEAKLLVNEGRTNKLNNFISKNNKEFSACLKLENDKIVFDFK